MSKYLLFSGTLACLLVLGLPGCSNSDSTGDGGRKLVKIDGSSTVSPISEAVAEEFQAEHKVFVMVGTSGTGGGFKKFSAGETDISNASRAIKDSEKKACADGGIEYFPLEVAYDGLAVMVHPENDWVKQMTTAQLKKIWQPASKVKKWSDVDPSWPDEDINLCGPGPDSGTFDYFTNEICGEEGASRPDYTASEDDNVLVRAISEDKYALGYFGYAYFAQNKNKLKLVPIDSGTGPVAPSEATVRDGTYTPLSRPLFIYVNKASLKRQAVAEFVKYYMVNAAMLATEVGYVPVSDEQANKNDEDLNEALGQ